MSDSEQDFAEVRSDQIGRTDSKLRNSIETYGSNSYYYAHSKSKEFVVPEGAKVVEGPGIITGGAPVKLDILSDSEPVAVSRRIEKYAWSDDGDKVRIYVDDPNILPLIADSSDNVSCEFDPQSMCLEVKQSSAVTFKLNVEELSEEIDTRESSYKVSLGKRITITLKKKEDKKWYSLKRK